MSLIVAMIVTRDVTAIAASAKLAHLGHSIFVPALTAA